MNPANRPDDVTLSRPRTPPPVRAMLRLLACALFLLGLVMVVMGIAHAWRADGDLDMQTRVAEYEAFRLGIYPVRPLEPDVPPTVRVPYTVYPPYALAMFAPFFEPFGKLQGRVVIEVLSLLALCAVARYGHGALRAAGAEAAAVGAVAALAISGTGNALALGQFSIICAGATIMQVAMLERGRPLAAAAWWVVAMLKPQIGLAFAGLFVVRREWRALASGVGLLVLLSLAACWWTEVSPLALVEHWTARMSVGFARNHSLPGLVATSLGVEPRIVHVCVAMLAVVLVPLLLQWRLVAARGVEPLVVAALAAVLGRVGLYHLFYDNVMMVPLLFALLVAAARRPDARRVAAAAAMGMSLWIPERLLDRLPHHDALRSAVWVACAVALVAEIRRDPGPEDAQRLA